ncbi:hypothetical protein WJX81_004890 [Elliptochloris bilobata]|uniref:Uncharacterized protein n=1 Tax=Elliptochloris bilobata TaxID=381761 RepID=A0AAW1S336_9CHLO
MVALTENGADTGPQSDAYQKLNADAKRKLLWSNIDGSAYADEALPMSDPSLLATLPLVWPPYLKKTFLNGGDELEPGRIKVIHTYGSTAKVALQFAPTAGGAARYTGVYGSDCSGLARISMARLAFDSFTPGMALKVLVNGRPSINMVAMYSLDGQGKDRNLFSNTWSHFLAKPASFPLKVVGAAFHMALPLISSERSGRPLDEEHMPLLEGAQVGPDGAPVNVVRAPHQLLYKPTPEVTRLYAPHMAADIRVALRKIPAGTVLWEVWAKPSEAAPEERIGRIVTESEFVTSKYGDEKLYFQHQRHRGD